MSAVPTDLITPRRAARILQSHISTVYRYVMKGKLRAWKRGGERYLVSEAEVRSLIRPVEVQGEVQTPAEEEAQAAAAAERLRARGYRF